MPLDDDQLRAVGRITVMSARLEYTVNALAWVLIYPFGAQDLLTSYGETIEIGRRALAGDSFASVIMKVQKLSEYVLRDSPKTLTQVQQWTAKARDLQERRNEIIHAWWYESSTGEIAPYRLLGRAEPRETRTSVTELDKLGDDIQSALDEVKPIFQAMRLPRFPP